MGSSVSAMRRAALRAQCWLSRRCDKNRGSAISEDPQASVAVEKILGRWSNLEGRVASAVTKRRGKKPPVVGTLRGRRSNRPSLSEEEVRWRAEHEGDDPGSEPVWYKPSEELATAAEEETSLGGGMVARTAVVRVRQGKMGEVEALYRGAIAEAYRE